MCERSTRPASCGASETVTCQVKISMCVAFVQIFEGLIDQARCLASIMLYSHSGQIDFRKTNINCLRSRQMIVVTFVRSFHKSLVQNRSVDVTVTGDVASNRYRSVYTPIPSSKARPLQEFMLYQERTS